MKHISAIIITMSLVLAGCGGSSSSSSSNSSGCQALSDSVSFTLNAEGTVAEMSGTLDCTSVDKVTELLKNDSLKTIRMLNVPGSADDVTNLKAAAMVRAAELDIVLAAAPAGRIASGGVDFFIAGVNRTLEAGGLVAVHSWAAGDGTQGIELYSRNPDAADHQRYIEYYKNMGFTTQEATDFYVYTLRAAPADKTHCMSAAELRQFKVVTNPQLEQGQALAPTTNDGGDYCNSYVDQPVPNT